MKNNLILAVLVSIFVLPSFAATSLNPAPGPVKASAIRFQVGPDKKWISLQDLAYMTPKEYAALNNKHMNLLERVQFSLGQKKLRNSIDADGTINNKRLANMVAPSVDGETGFHIGGFALGFLLGLIGILIAYLIKDDKQSNRRKWAWIGFGAFLVIYIAIILATI